MSETVIIMIWSACLCVAGKIEGAATSQGGIMSEGSPGTADDLTGRRECMQKPHVQQPAVNSKYVVSLAGHCIFFPVHTQFASNKDKASSRVLSFFFLFRVLSPVRGNTLVPFYKRLFWICLLAFPENLPLLSRLVFLFTSIV